MDKLKNVEFTVSKTNNKDFTTNWKSIYIVTLVAFIASIHQNCVMVWPYLKLLDCSSTEMFYGILRTISSFGSVFAALTAGYLSNYLRNTKWPMTFAKIMAILSCLLYISIETMSSGRKWAFFLFEFTLGISTGAANIYKVHIAMASTEVDLAKAVGICSMAPTLGLLVGPLIQLSFTSIKYPGIQLMFGTHINLYTAPILLTIVISIVGIYLLLFHFDGEMRIPSEKSHNLPPILNGNELTTNICADPILDKIDDEIHKIKFDIVAVSVCLFTRATIFMAILILTTVFQWTNSESVIFSSILLILIALQGVAWNLAYIFFNLRERICERKAIVVGLIMLFMVFTLTYPWPFIGTTIPYQEDVVILQDIDQCSKNTTSTIAQDTPLGCPQNFKWCSTTHQVNMYIYLIGSIIAWGSALPLCFINLDILFTKILGRIKQGTMQGIFIASGEGLSLFMPIVLSQIYTETGPIYIWMGMIGFFGTCILSWFYFYSRMISKTQRLEKF